MIKSLEIKKIIKENIESFFLDIRKKFINNPQNIKSYYGFLYKNI